MLIETRGFIPPVFHLDSTAQDEGVKCKWTSTLEIGAWITTNTFQSASGISFKSQFLYLMVYLTRYVDLLWTFYEPKSLYNTCFKIIFIGTSAYTVYLMLNGVCVDSRKSSR